MLHLLRPLKERIMAPIGAKLVNTSPNFVTVLAMIPAILAAFFWYLGGTTFLILASICTILNGFLDLLDGYMAREHGKVSPLGDFLDCVVDRYSDVVILMGIAFSIYANPLIAHMAIVAVLLVSFLGSQSQASGGGRVESGILGRAERMVLLILFPWVTIISSKMGYNLWWKFTPVEWLLIVLTILGHLTAFFRIREGVVMLSKIDQLSENRDNNNDKE